jgi:cytochrome b561
MILLLCIAQVPTAWAVQRTHMVSGGLEQRPFDLFVRQVHAWSGWLIMGLAFLLLVLRIRHGRPAPVEGTSRLAQKFAAITHLTLYGLRFALAATSTVAMYLTFSVAPIHSLLSWTLLAVAVAHAGAALWHHFWRRDDVLCRMVRSAP